MQIHPQPANRLNLHSDALSLLCVEPWRTSRRRLDRCVFHTGAESTGKHPQAYFESDEITEHNAEEVPNDPLFKVFAPQ